MENKRKENSVSSEQVQHLRSIPDTLPYAVMTCYLAQSACYWHNILQPSTCTINYKLKKKERVKSQVANTGSLVTR